MLIAYFLRSGGTNVNIGNHLGLGALLLFAGQPVIAGDPVWTRDAIVGTSRLTIVAACRRRRRVALDCLRKYRTATMRAEGMFRA